MATKAKRVIIGIEVISEAIEDARFNAQLNGIENAAFFCGEAEEAAKRFTQEGLCHDVVVMESHR